MVWYAVVFYVMLGVPGTYVYPHEYNSSDECLEAISPRILEMREYFSLKTETYPETYVDAICIVHEFNTLGKI